MGFVIAVVFIGTIGLVGLAMSANAIYEYGKAVEMGAIQYTYGHEAITPTYSGARSQAYKDQELINISDGIYKMRDICIDNERIQVADERVELFELLAQAASLVDTIRARS